MGATFSRVKNWTTETLTNTDLNAEIDNILNNLDPSGVDDYSATAAQMRLTADGGEYGTESLATSLAGELQRLRFAIKELKGSDATYWYSSVNTSLTDLLTAVGGSGLAANRIASGKASSNSNAPRYLVPSGTTTSITLDAAPTNLVYFINGTQYTATADVTFAGMQTASASNNTCLIADSFLSGQESSKWAGEDGTRINITSVGTDISSLVNKYAAFKVVSGGLTEYFIGFVNTASITNCLRGCFIDSSLAAIPRIPISNSNTISLMGLGWIFANATGGIGVSYVNPIVSNSTPSVVSGYWYDLGGTAWKTYNGSTWNNVTQTLIGMSIQTTNACVGVRGMNFYAAYSDYSNMQLDWISATTLQQRNYGGKIAVGSSLIDYKMTKPTWDITVDRETGYGESASTTYFAYVGENGQNKVSPEKPYYSQDLGRGWYHPYENWRAVGYVNNDASSNLDVHTLNNYVADPKTQPWLACDDIRNIGMAATVNASAMLVTVHGLDGNPLSPGNPGYANFRVNQTVGTAVTRVLYNNLNMTVPSGANLGCVGGMSQYEWVHLADNNGTIDSVITAQIPFADGAFTSSTQLSSSATIASVAYSQGAAYVSKATRYVGRITSNNATASSWVTAPTDVTLRAPFVQNLEYWGQVNRTISWNQLATLTTGYQNRRVGDTLEFRGYIQVTSSTAAAISLNLPTGITADLTKLMIAGPRNQVGTYLYLDNGAGGSQFNNVTSALGAIAYNNSLSLTVLYPTYNGAGSTFAQVNASTIFLGSTSAMTLEFKIPVIGWSVYGP